MEIYDNNIQVFRNKNHLMYGIYIEKLKKGVKEAEVRSIMGKESRDGNVSVTIETDTQKIRLNSAYYPEKEAVQWAKQFVVEHMQTVVEMYGMGNGLFVRALQERLPKDAKIILYEPSFAIFDWVMHHVDIRDILASEQIVLCVEDINENDVNTSMEMLVNEYNLESQIICYHTGYDLFMQDKQKKFAKTIIEVNERIQVNKNTMTYFAESMIHNMLRNFKFLKEGKRVTDCQDLIPKDMPVIIVSAGPSLDKNIHLLKKAKGKAFILATDTAVRYILKQGILPDAMITLDARKPTNYISDPAVKEVPMFCTLQSNADIMEFHQGVKIWYNTKGCAEHFFEHYHAGLPSYDAGGSVATAAFTMAVVMQAKTIILMGQDLAYQGHITHAGGEVSGVENEESGVQMVEGIDGTMVKSRYDWLIYRDWFAASIEELNKLEEGYTFVDATEGGAKIDGTQIMSFQEAIQTYCVKEVDVSKAFWQIPAAFSEENYRRIQEEMRHYPEELVQIQMQATEAKKACDKLVRILGDMAKEKKQNQYRKVIAKVNQEIEEKNVYMLIENYANAVSNDALNSIFATSGVEDDRKFYEKAAEFYGAVIKVARELHPKFEEAIYTLAHQ